MKRLRRGILLLALGVAALLFLFPTVLTVVNSFLSEGEIQQTYGAALGDRTTEYMAQTVVPKLIPDQVSAQQYQTFLVESPEDMRQAIIRHMEEIYRKKISGKEEELGPWGRGRLGGLREGRTARGKVLRKMEEEFSQAAGRYISSNAGATDAVFSVVRF